MDNKMTQAILKERQSWTLMQKIDHSLGAIDQFISRMDGKVYVSFSGGKDSTVLLHLCRIIKPDIKAVFCNTGNEYPDIVKFVRSIENVEIIYPRMKPEEVLAKHGFPLVSKEQSSLLHEVRFNPNTYRTQRALGKGRSDDKYRGKISDKWLFLKDKPYATSDKCCYELKKKPFENYFKSTGLYPILGVMAIESNARTQEYGRMGGCNVFTGKIKSHPLSIWTDKDIWGYIEDRKLDISDIYKKGAVRTGCMFCGYGAQSVKDNDQRFQRVLELYPKMYHKFMAYENNGITYRQALRDVLGVNGLCLPDEMQPDLFELFK